LNGVTETTKNLTNAIMSATSTTTKGIISGLKNVRLDDLTSVFIRNPYQHINITTTNTIDKDEISPDMINQYNESANDNEHNHYEYCDFFDDFEHPSNISKRSETKLNEEYLLSIHSTNMRSRRKLHIRGPEDVVNLDRQTVDLIDANICLNQKVVSIINDMEHKHKLSLDSVSFSGGGYNCMYHIGVVRYIFENPELFHNTKYLGASGGAGIVSLVLCFEHDPNKFIVLQEILDFVVGLRYRNLKLSKQVDEYSSMLIHYMTEDRFNKYILNSDRCHISITNVTYIIPLNEIKTKFTSYVQFIDTLKASACIPILLDNTIRTVDYKRYLDGGLSNNLPIIDENTVKISCLNYPFMKAHIYPKYVCDIMYSFTPPDKNYIMNMHDQGYNDINLYMNGRYLKLQALNNDKDLNECITILTEDSTFCV